MAAWKELMTEMFEAPIIVVGAHRSGTKMLRELLKLHPAVTGELYEEERIWCYGHKDRQYKKRIEAGELSLATKNYIRNYFRRKARRHQGQRIIDKNTFNSVRLDYVKAIFPESPVVHILRDGRAAAASLKVRWQKPLDWQYILRELAFPVKEVPHFLSRQIRYNWSRFFSGNERVNLYGVWFEGIEEMLESHSLIEVCGRQWLECVEAVLNSAQRLDDDEYIEVRYEDVVTDSPGELRRLVDFLGLEHLEEVYKRARSYVRPGRLDKWQYQLTPQEVELLTIWIGELQKRLGYM